MPFPVYCPNCSQGFNAPDHLGGQRVACPSCQVPFVVPPPNDPLADPLGSSIPATRPAAKKRRAPQSKRSGNNSSTPLPTGKIVLWSALGLALFGAATSWIWLRSRETQHANELEEFHANAPKTHDASPPPPQTTPEDEAEGMMRSGLINVNKLLLIIEGNQNVDDLLAHDEEIHQLAKELSRFWPSANALEFDAVRKRHEAKVNDLSMRLEREWNRVLPLLVKEYSDFLKGASSRNIRRRRVRVPDPRKPPIGFAYEDTVIRLPNTNINPVAVKLPGPSSSPTTPSTAVASNTGEKEDAVRIHGKLPDGVKLPSRKPSKSAAPPTKTKTATLNPPPMESKYPKADMTMTIAEWQERHRTEKAEWVGKVVDVTGMLVGFRREYNLMATLRGPNGTTSFSVAANRPWSQILTPVEVTVRVPVETTVTEGYLHSLGESLAVRVTADQLVEDHESLSSSAFAQKYRAHTLITGSMKAYARTTTKSGKPQDALRLSTNSGKFVDVYFTGNQSIKRLFMAGKPVSVLSPSVNNKEGLRADESVVVRPTVEAPPIPYYDRPFPGVGGTSPYLRITANGLAAHVAYDRASLRYLRTETGDLIRGRVDILGVVGEKYRDEELDDLVVPLKNDHGEKIVVSNRDKGDANWMRLAEAPVGTTVAIIGSMNPESTYEGMEILLQECRLR